MSGSQRLGVAALLLAILVLRALTIPRAAFNWDELALFDSVARSIQDGVLRSGGRPGLAHLLVMPLTPFQIMAAKVWANGLVVLMVAAASLAIVVQGALAMPIAGSVALFLFAAMLHLFSTTALGILLATIARAMPQFALLMILVVVPLNMLSGSNAPPESMPPVVQSTMLAAPTTHFVSLAQAVLFRGAGLSVVWPQLLANLAIGAIFFLVALARFRRTVALS